MITLTAERQIGPTLRKLRYEAGLTVRQVARIAHLSINGIHHREQSHAGYIGMFVEHVSALGHTVVIVPQRHPGARPTGTGWPA